MYLDGNLCVRKMCYANQRELLLKTCEDNEIVLLSPVFNVWQFNLYNTNTKQRIILLYKYLLLKKLENILFRTNFQ